MKQFIIVFIFFFSYCFGCAPFDKSSRSVKKESEKIIKRNNYNLLWTAMSENKLFLFFLENFSNNYFILLNSEQSIRKVDRFHAGYYQVKSDTMFLSFLNNFQPFKMGNYFLKDTSRRFLIYPLKDTSSKLYLKIRYPK
jgi:hypothetical protein